MVSSTMTGTGESDKEIKSMAFTPCSFLLLFRKYFFMTTSVNGKLQNCNCGSPKIFNLNETYICPNNGYVHIRNITDQSGYISLYSSNNIQIGTLRPITTIGGTTAEISCFIRKGTRLQTGGVAFNYCQYIPLDE